MKNIDFNKESKLQKKSEILSQYQIKKKLGHGLFSEVFYVVNQFDEDRAIKIIKKKSFSTKEAIHKIIIEKEILKMLDHPNILKLYKSMQSNSSLFFELEYCSIGSIICLLNSGVELNIEDIRFIFVQVLEGLLYMHSK